MDSIRYIGHSGFELNLKGSVVLIDPFFGAGMREKCKIPLITPSLIKKADIILLTHEHTPHCDAAAIKEIAERTGASVVGPSITLKKIDINQRQKVDVGVGDSFLLKGVDISVTKAAHPQSQYPVGYIVSAGDSPKVYHAGDTYQFAEMQSINVDFAILPIGGGYTMDIIDAANASKLIRTKFIIPMHYNTYDRISQDVSDFIRRVSRAKVVAMEPDQSIELRRV